MGTVIEPVPVTGFAANFSPMPRMAPPPLGRFMDGAETANESFWGALFFSETGCLALCLVFLFTAKPLFTEKAQENHKINSIWVMTS